MSKVASLADLGELPPFLRRKTVIELVAGEGALKRMEQAGWLAPKVRERKYVIYGKEDVLACLARLNRGEFPQK